MKLRVMSDAGWDHIYEDDKGRIRTARFRKGDVVTVTDKEEISNLTSLNMNGRPLFAEEGSDKDTLRDDYDPTDDEENINPQASRVPTLDMGSTNTRGESISNPPREPARRPVQRETSSGKPVVEK